MVQRKRAFCYWAFWLEVFNTIAKLSQVCFRSFHFFFENSARLSGGGGLTSGNGGQDIVAWLEVGVEGKLKAASAAPVKVS